VERRLPEWGRKLFDSLETEAARTALEGWRGVAGGATRRFSVLVEPEVMAGEAEERVARANEGATLLLALPWELAHDDEGYLFQGKNGVRVRRRMPNRRRRQPLVTDPPIRILLASPRPEDERAAYIDHRVSARPLVDALEPLGELAEVEILEPPTFPALGDALRRAADAGRPFHVVHFDGHGVFDREHGLGGLCFEDPRDEAKLEKRRSKIVMADELAGQIRDHRVPLVFLEACQSATAEDEPTASVAGRLLSGGVASVVAMTHTVLVETARRFVERFYRELMAGGRIGKAVLEGRNALKADTFRHQVFTGELHLEDWYPKQARLLVERALGDRPVIVVFDNMESGRLDRDAAVELVGKVLEEQNAAPRAGDAGESEEEVEELVDAVGRHARSLVLLTREVATAGVRTATENLHQLMAALADRHPDDRERSLFASVELSLRRLPEATRRKLPPLGVFRGGGHGWVIAQVLGLDYQNDEEIELARQLTAVGLAEPMPYGHLRLHPALPPALWLHLDDGEREAVRKRWVEAVVGLTGYLYRQRTQDTKLAFTLALLELPNLLAALEHLARTAGAERVVGVATNLEGLLQPLGRPKALARVVAVREEAARGLGEWSHARLIAESAAVDRLLDAGRHREAMAAARSVLERGLAAGEGAYEGAPYDVAMAHFQLGRVLKEGGAAQAALAPLVEARERFRKLAEGGNRSAAGMAMTCLTETGDCLQDLGRLDEAAQVYKASSQEAEELGDLRGGAVAKGQLGTVRLLQRRYGDALATFTEARETFEELGEPGSVAVAWHQIGRVHQEAGQHEAAERAYQRSLKIKVERGNRSGEALTLNQLGNLYGSMGRLEESVSFYRQAAAVYAELGDQRFEGFARNNAAARLLRLGHHDEARWEIERAIECKEPFGHSALPWTTFDILSDLERAVGDDAAAGAARERAIEAYLAYRRDGGENHSTGGRLALAVGQALASGEVASQLEQWLEHPDLPNHPSFERLIHNLQAIVSGSRDPALASDPGLDFDDAAEVRLLLERLGG